jgi:predicted nuclease of predicted toxin-antitoxin system
LKIKIDENIGRRGIELLRQAGHDVMSVPEQGLSGAPDETVFHVCVSEGRTLITLDRDFGQVPRFPPKQSAGIVILELGTPATLASLQRVNFFRSPRRVQLKVSFGLSRPVVFAFIWRGTWNNAPSRLIPAPPRCGVAVQCAVSRPLRHHTD